MSEEYELPSEDELAMLPRFSVAVFALRCALRVQPQLISWKRPSAEYKKAVVRLKAASNILVANVSSSVTAADATATRAVTAATTKSGARAAYAAARAAAVATITAIDAVAATSTSKAVAAARDAVAATAFAADTASATTIAVKADYARLKELKNEVTDASEAGPLGDLWHGSVPDWYVEAKAKFDKTITKWESKFGDESPEDCAKRYEESDPDPLISVYFDDSDFTKDEMALFLEYMSESYRSIGGEGLKIVDGKTLLPENAKVGV